MLDSRLRGNDGLIPCGRNVPNFRRDVTQCPATHVNSGRSCGSESAGADAGTVVTWPMRASIGGCVPTGRWLNADSDPVNLRRRDRNPVVRSAATECGSAGVRLKTACLRQGSGHQALLLVSIFLTDCSADVAQRQRCQSATFRQIRSFWPRAASGSSGAAVATLFSSEPFRTAPLVMHRTACHASFIGA